MENENKKQCLSQQQRGKEQQIRQNFPKDRCLPKAPLPESKNYYCHQELYLNFCLLFFYSISFTFMMEDYERRKLYRVHLKNISLIKNCRTPLKFTAYSSRLFNFTLRNTFRKNQFSNPTKQNSPVKLSQNKKNEQRKTNKYYLQKQNLRIQNRLAQTSGSINITKYQNEYQEHKRIMKLHSKIKKFKRVILYKIYDIAFKGVSPNLTQQFVVYDISEFSKKRDNSSTKETELDMKCDELMRGNIFQIRNLIIKGYRDEKLVVKIVGRSQGIATILNDLKMVPIMHKNEIVGTLILEVG